MAGSGSAAVSSGRACGIEVSEALVTACGRIAVASAPPAMRSAAREAVVRIMFFMSSKYPRPQLVPPRIVVRHEVRQACRSAKYSRFAFVRWPTGLFHAQAPQDDCLTTSAALFAELKHRARRPPAALSKCATHLRPRSPHHQAPGACAYCPPGVGTPCPVCQA